MDELSKSVLDPEFFTAILEEIAGGKTLKRICEEHAWTYGATRLWIRGDVDRERDYIAAQAIAAEAHVEEGLHLVDSAQDKDDVPVKRLQSNYRRWYAGVLNREKFSDKQNGLNINLGANSLIAVLSSMPSSAQEALARIEHNESPIIEAEVIKHPERLPDVL